MSGAGVHTGVTLTLEQATAAMQSILAELAKPNVVEAIAAAREAAGADVGLIMQEVVPIFYEVQGHVMEPLGFTPDDDGFEAFAGELTKHESNADFLALSKQLKKIMKDSTTPPAPAADESSEE